MDTSRGHERRYDEPSYPPMKEAEKAIKKLFSSGRTRTPRGLSNAVRRLGFSESEVRWGMQRLFDKEYIQLTRDGKIRPCFPQQIKTV